MSTSTAANTYGYDIPERVTKVPGIPYGTYHIGSTNDLGRCEITRATLGELGLSGSRVSELLEAQDAFFTHRTLTQPQTLAPRDTFSYY